MRDVHDILRATIVERRYTDADVSAVQAVLARAGMDTQDAAGISLLAEYGLKYLALELDAPPSDDFFAPCPVCGRSEADVQAAEKSYEDDEE